MNTLSKLDIKVRLQLSGQKYSEILSKYIDSLKWGKKNSILLETKLTLLGIYIELLLDYTTLDNSPTPINNCLTESQAQLITDKISKLTNICFQPIGFVYNT